MKNSWIILFAVFVLNACSKKQSADPALATDQNILHNNVNALTQVIIHDVFSPPVASRIYVYTSLAAYEAIRFQKEHYPSITARLNGFDPMPEPEKGKSYNYLLSASKAFFTVAEKITFSKDTLLKYQDKLYSDFESLLDKETFRRSFALGEAIGKKILERTARDNYKETRGMSKFLGTNETGKWRPTPPDYLDAAEPHWGKMKPLAIDSAAQFKCPAPPAYAMVKDSFFFRNAEEVYMIVKNLTPEQREIAKYWDDNPFVMEHSGHLMYGNKKITPPGHWIGITTIAAKMKNSDAVDAARAYALTATAMFDSFISCWNEKFQTQVIRPITFINENLDHNWQPFLQTPPFPEYPSGHSSVSAAASTVLTELYGEFPFEDTSDLPYIGMKRSFPSFRKAAEEASISRVYGGIHFRSGVDAGAAQGNMVADHIVRKFLGRDSFANVAGGKN